MWVRKSYVAAFCAVFGLSHALSPDQSAADVTLVALSAGETRAGVTDVGETGLGATGVEAAHTGEMLRSDAPHVTDGDTLVLGQTRVRLFGMDAPELSQRCTDMRGKSWACGAWSKAELERLVAKGVRCEVRDTDRYGRTVAACFTVHGDVAAAMVARGAAYAYEKYAADYLAAESIARAGGLGLWRAGAEKPAAFRAAKQTALPAQIAPNGCDIKGNISKSGRIYHLPGGRWYQEARINEAKGEQWFCSEKDARAAGWRPAKG